MNLSKPFKLTLDSRLPQNTPIGLLPIIGLNQNVWWHNGQKITGRENRTFCLVQIGHQPNLAAAKAVLKARYGPMPVGQWLMAYKQQRGQQDGKGPVGIADDSWADRFSRCYFLCTDSHGKPYLRYNDSPLPDFWRWLVFAPSKKSAPKN